MLNKTMKERTVYRIRRGKEMRNEGSYSKMERARQS